MKMIRDAKVHASSFLVHGPFPGNCPVRPAIDDEATAQFFEGFGTESAYIIRRSY
jgi:hypothetical protein